MKTQIYVESSVISYLTSRPPRDIIRLARHRLTAEWWENREKWNLCISPTVVEEISAGDPEAADRRIAVAKQMMLLPALPEARNLANLLVVRGAVPTIAFSDALHLALAALHKLPFLLTWNQRHLDNIELRSRIEEVIRSQGLHPALVLTPERILEENHD